MDSTANTNATRAKGAGKGKAPQTPKRSSQSAKAQTPAKENAKQNNTKTIIGDTLQQNQQQSNEHTMEGIQQNQKTALWEILRSSTGNVSNIPHLFSQDEKYVICASENYVVIFSAVTGDWVRKLHKHKEKVTGTMLNPNNPLQIISSSFDGMICVWDLLDGSLLNSYQLDWNVVQILPNSAKSGFIHVAVYAPPAGNNDTPLELYEKGVFERKLAHRKGKFITKIDYEAPPLYNLLDMQLSSGAVSELPQRLEGYFYDAHRNGSFVVGCHNMYVNVYFRETDTVRSWSHNQVITCVAVHPTQDMIAIGDIGGSIYLWRSINSVGKDQSPGKTRMHWHANPVSDITFTEDGLYLLSVGKESVFVLWQVETLQHQFLPRLGAPLRYVAISPGGKYYGISNDDNEILIIQASTLNIKAIAQGLKIASVRCATSNCVGLIQHPGKTLLLSNGAPGKLQIFQIHPERYICDVPVVLASQNTRASDAFVVAARIDHMTLTHNGAFLVTASRIVDTESSEVSLKFWSFDTKSNNPAVTLNTRVDAPHKARITSVVAHPKKDVAVTTSMDGRFKTWIPSTKQKQARNPEKAAETSRFWGCRSVGLYRNYPARHAAFSHDGSLLAVAFENIITLWDYESNEMKSTISHPAIQSNFLRIGFILDSPYLVSTSENRLCVWDILSNNLLWEMEMTVSELFFDPIEKRFGALIHHKTVKAKYTYIVILNHESPRPLDTLRVPDTLQNASFYVIPGTNDSCVIAYNSKREVVLFKKKDMTITEKLSTESAEEFRGTDFVRLFGQINPDNQAKAAAQTNNDFKQDQLSLVQFVAAPSHILPPIEQMFDSFVEASMTRINVAPELEDVYEESVIPRKDDDDDMEDQQSLVQSRKEVDNDLLDVVPPRLVKFKFDGFETLAPAVSHSLTGTSDTPAKARESEAEPQQTPQPKTRRGRGRGTAQ
eukprot:TRINITY_DN6760_c0_g1_i2.p1 TRINITY_DN6760_c0_g1~~TRINITY_DN6760_c0_g1_i2.p1  ORF type:complete len:947 (+),score=169.38 TRINITY_DN6760_c0_g1_i2:52-2892(+)